MKRTQIQLPDPLYEQIKKVARQLDWSVAELIRRGAEYMVKCYAASGEDTASGWRPPRAHSLGEFLATPEKWRELANEPGQE